MEKLINTNYKYGIDIIIIEILILSLKYDSNYNNIHHYIYYIDDIFHINS